VAAAGVPMGGITAMNEAGLTLTVHQHMFTDRARLGGMPIGIVGDIVMRKAESLDDAEAILREQTPIGCWTYVVADGRRREVLCWEENPDRRAPRRIAQSEGSFGYANVYLDAELGKSEKHLYGSYWRHNAARHRRANELLFERQPLDARAMAAILADTGDERCRISEAIAMIMTVGSVVFRPDDGVFWVATGKAPSSHHEFLPFDLASEDHAPEHGSLSGHAPGDGQAAFDHYREAYLAHFDREDLAEARRQIELARALRPNEPLYGFLAGVLALADCDLGAAAAALDSAIALGHPHAERLAAFHLWRGRVHDAAGRRSRALDDYRMALAHPADDGVQRAARRGLRRRFSPRRARKIALELVYADVTLT
jgi:hypothetical protein